MSSLLRYSAVAAFISSVSGFAIGQPSPTLPGLGDDFSPVPTTAPAFELVKAKLEKKAVTNWCTEWTIPGGYGTPYCLGANTCVFAAVSGYGYEGCGQVGVEYNWISECWNYGVSTGVAPVSQTYCPSSAPWCGFYAFIFSTSATYWNYGCATEKYELYVDLITTAGNSGALSSTHSLVIAPTSGASSTATAAPSDPTVTVTASPSGGGTPTASNTGNSGGTSVSPGPATTTTPVIVAHSSPSKSNAGAIAGGVVGGLAVIAISGFLIFWFCLRGRSDRKAAAQADAAQNAQTTQVAPPTAPAAAAAAAPHTYQAPTNNASEISGTAKPMTAFTPANNQNTPTPVAYAEKPSANSNQSAYTENQQQNAPSPPPVYSGNFAQQQQNPPQNQQYPPQTAQQYPPQNTQQYPPQNSQQYPPQHAQQYPPQQHPQQYPAPIPTSSPSPIHSPGSHYSELPHGAAAVAPPPPVSPAPTSTYTQSPPLGTSELMAGAAGAGVGAAAGGYQRVHSPPPQNQNINELGGQNRASYQVPPHVQEMSGTGGATRPPPPPQGPPPGHGQQVQYDMSGNPMNEEFRGHELA